MKFTIVLLTLCVVSALAKMRIDNQWPGGFQATVDIPITKEIKDAWEVEFILEREVLFDVSGHIASYTHISMPRLSHDFPHRFGQSLSSRKLRICDTHTLTSSGMRIWLLAPNSNSA